MISIYFGSPGSGKSTYACYLASKAKKNGYKRVYSNFPIKGVTSINTSDIGVYDFSEGEKTLLIVDEASIDYNSRSYKSLPKSVIAFAKLHRHYHCDIVMFSQSYDDMDVTFRRLANNYFYIERSVFPFLLSIRRIRCHLDIKEGEIVDFFEFVLFSRKFVFMPKYWKMFDSYSTPVLPKYSI